MIKKNVLLCLFGFVILSCNNGKAKKENIYPAKIAEEETVVENPILKEGKKNYTQYCLACHQSDGLGVSGMNPPLARTSWVLGDKERIIKVVLNGLSNDVDIDGETYSNSMGSFETLTDKEIASILTYVRQSFGNDASAVNDEEVAVVRSANK